MLPRESRSCVVGECRHRGPGRTDSSCLARRKLERGGTSHPGSGIFGSSERGNVSNSAAYVALGRPYLSAVILLVRIAVLYSMLFLLSKQLGLLGDRLR